MKYSPLDNQPNVTRTRAASTSPSLKLDSRSFPHITWLEEQLDRYSFNYSFWDGLKWSYNDFPEIYVSKEEITTSPCALVLDDNENPVATFARKIGSGNRLSLATYNGRWNFNNFDVDYDLNWIGVTKNRRGIEYSSSSSSSSSYIENWSSSSSSPSSSSFSSPSSSSPSSKSSKSSNSSSSSSSSPSSPSSSSPSTSSSSSSYVNEWTSSSSSSSSSSYVNEWTSSSSSTSSGVLGAWVTETGETPSGNYLFFNDSFSVIESRTLPTSNVSGKDYKSDGYYTFNYVPYASKIRKYSYSGVLLNEYNVPSLYSDDYGYYDISVDEINSVAYLSSYYFTLRGQNSLIIKVDLSTGSIITSRSFFGVSFLLKGLFFDGVSIYAFFGNQVIRMNSSLTTTATKSISPYALVDGYLENDFWYLTFSEIYGPTIVSKYTNDGDMPGVYTGIYYLFTRPGYFGRADDYHEASSSSYSSYSSSSSSSSSSSPSSFSSLGNSQSSSSSSTSESSGSSSSNSSSSESSSSPSSSSSSFNYSTSSSSSSIDSHSSSSSSSYDDSPYFVTLYDTTNNEFKVYSVGSSWDLMGSQYQSNSPSSCIKIDSCEAHIGMGFIDEESDIRYNFFNLNTESWSYPSFPKLVASQTYNNVLDMDLAGYNIEESGVLNIGWLSKQDEYFYVCNELVDNNGTETPTDYVSVVVESNPTDVITDYISNGYRKISVYKNGDFYGMFTIGSACKYFLNYKNTMWSGEPVDIASVSNGIVCNSIRNQNGKITFESDSGDIYYFEPSLSEYGFEISTPDMVVLNDKWAKRIYFSSIKMQGYDILNTYENNCGSILFDSIKRVSVVSNKSIAPQTTTTTTTTKSLYCCSNMQPDILLPGGCKLSEWNINWMGHDNSTCQLILQFGYPKYPMRLGFILTMPLSYVVTYGITSSPGSQTLSLIPQGIYGVSGTVNWNGVPVASGDSPFLIHTLYCQ